MLKLIALFLVLVEMAPNPRTTEGETPRNDRKMDNKVDVYDANPFRTLKHLTGYIHYKTRSKSKIKQETQKAEHKSQHFVVPLHLVLFGYLNYTVLFVISWIKELIYGMGPWRGKHIGMLKEGERRAGYAPLYSSFESFYTRNVYRRLKGTFNNAIGSVPGAIATHIDRESEDDSWNFELKLDQRRDCVNLASYNYLGYAETKGECTEKAVACTSSLGVAACSSSHEIGKREIHKELESTVAEFLGVEDAITFGMGFATNALNIPRLLSKDCLVISDEYNHASIILGLRLSGATIKVFKHNNVQNLEQIIRNAIIMGHPRTHRPWKKIFIAVEGIYSMEGTICKLPEIIELKKKYRAYLYLDEAHSVGAMGPRGRGIVDFFGCNPEDVDILMGTFTKSFGAAGGYIAGRRDMINYLRLNSEAASYCSTVSPPVAQQILAALRSIMDPTKDGIARTRQLARNTKYFRSRLKQMGFVISGDESSPVIPLMLFMPSKIVPFVEICRENAVAAVGVGFPATRLTEERMRFCLSAGHTKEMLDRALAVIDWIGDYVNVKYAKSSNPEETILY